MGKKGALRKSRDSTANTADKQAGGGGLGGWAPLVVGCAIGAVAMFAMQGMPGLGDIGGHPQEVVGSGGSGGGGGGGGGHKAASSSGGVALASGDISIDCSGRRFHSAWVDELWGDEFCDNGWVSVNLSCPEYNWDGGDCDESQASEYIKPTTRGGGKPINYLTDEGGDGAKARNPNEVYTPNDEPGAWASVYPELDPPSEATLPLRPRPGPKYGVTDKMVRSYQEDGHVLVRGLIAPSEIEPFREPLARALGAQSEQPVAGTSEYMAFRRSMDGFRRVPGSAHYNFSTSGRMAAAAARLMGTKGARVYMDQIFFKYVSNHETAWHADMPMFPFLFNGPCVSAWIPLVPVSTDHGPLQFLTGSHLNSKGLLHYIPYDHPNILQGGQAAIDQLEASMYGDPSTDTMFVLVEEGFGPGHIRSKQDEMIRRHYGDSHIADYGDRKAGDVSFHSCKTLHATQPNTDPSGDNRTREAIAIVYMGTEISKFQDANDLNFAPALLPKDELRRIGADNAGFFKLPVNRMSWTHTAWMHPPFHDPKPGEFPRIVEFGKVAKGAVESERPPLVFSS